MVCHFDSARRTGALATASGLTPAEVHARLFTPTGFDAACDRGDYRLPEIEAELNRLLGLAATITEYAAWWAIGLTPNDQVLALLRRARETAYLATLTNNGPLVRAMLERHFPEVVAAFDELRFSYQVQAVKPDPRVFERTLAALGFAPAETVFVDDTGGHVDGARAVGVDGIHFTTVEDLAAALTQRGYI